MRLGVPAEVEAEGRDELPTLVFNDLAAALDYYVGRLGFTQEAATAGARDVVVRAHQARLRLRQAEENELDGREVTWKRVDATLLVDRPYRLYRHIDDRGCETLDGFEPGRDGYYRIMDPFTNVIAIGATGGLVPALSRAVLPPASDRALIAWRMWRNVVRERRYQRDFRQFYESLPNKKDIYYMFFLGGGLLHWVAKAASYVPQDVNLVFVGSDLPDDELTWLREKSGRPFFHIDTPVDDKTAWKFLLETNDNNFGWIDIDCLVLNEALFDEMATMAPDTSVNGTWWYDSGFGFPITATYFQFVNIAAERAMRSAGFVIDPTIYAYYPFNLDVPGARYYTRVLPRSVQQQLLKIIPADGLGRPFFPGPTHPETGEVLYYDTTVVRQLVARTLGFEGHQVRQLKRRGLGGTGFDLEELSDDLVHIGGVSYDNRVSQMHSADETKVRYLLADHVALTDVEGRLPDSYLDRRRRVSEQLATFGFDAEGATEAARLHLIEERGISPAAAEAVLRSPAERARVV